MNDSNTFFDVYYQPGENPVFCYRSANAVYEETLYNGALVSSGYNDAGYPLNILSNFPTRLDERDFAEPFAFNIEIDGQSVDFGNKFVDFITERTEKHIKATLVLENTFKPVRIKVHTLLDGTQTFIRFLEIENLSEENLTLSRLTVLGGGLEEINLQKYIKKVPFENIYSLGYFDSDQWGNEGEFNWHPINCATTSIDTRFNRDRFRQPLIFIRNNLTGKMWFSQIGWSGGCRFSVDCNAQSVKDDVYLSFKAEIIGHNPMYILRPKEIFISPEVHQCVIHGDLDDAVNDMNAHIRKSVLNLPEADPKTALVGCGMGAEHDMSVETSKAFIRQFKELGGEIFIVDAGWECPPSREAEWGDFNGINIPHSERYPEGITEIVDYCHHQGLKFGLWVDIESLGKYSEVYNNHPDWRACNVFGKKTERFLDFTVREAAEWAENELARIITEYKLDLLRVDYNTSFRDYFNIRNTGSGIPECVTLRHFNAVQKMYLNLKKRFPDVIFENCAGGGGRCDLYQMKAFNHTWVSDCQCAPRSVLITNSLTMSLPPERVDRLFAGMNCHIFGDLSAQMRNCMLGHMSINVTSPASAELNTVQADFVKHSISVYKEFIRPFLSESKIYHHTAETKKCIEDGFCALEIASPDKSKGAATVFSLAAPESKSYTLKIKGAALGKEYKVTLDNSGESFKISGRDLSLHGINIFIPSPMSSELVLYEEI